MVATERMGRERTFNIRFSDEEWERLERLCEKYGLNAASVIRFLMKRADDEVTAATPYGKAVQREMARATAAKGKGR